MDSVGRWNILSNADVIRGCLLTLLKSLHRSTEINNFFRRDLDSEGGGDGGGAAAAPHSFPAPATLKKEEAARRGWMTPVENPLALRTAFASNANFSTSTH